ncbi:MAG: hypothetical protein JWR27_1009 [Aeromicrobium sp.]|nr:hypothetical protein [Aeromicrobium sp.]
MTSHLPTAHRGTPASTGPLFILAQFVPMLVLAGAYFHANHRIEASSLGGVRLDRLLLTSAVIAPLLTQSVSGPLFRSLEIRPTRRLADSAALTLRNLPRATAVATPIVIASAGATAWALGMSRAGAVALAAVAGVHVLFASTLVPAYAHRNGWLLILGWSSYAVTLAWAPQIWWAPSVVGFVSELLVLLTVCSTRMAGVPVAGYRAMLAGLLRGVSLAFPLWCLPVMVYLATDGDVSPVAIFLAMTPALLAYQVYFVTVATPVWTTLDGARRMLADDAYPRARRELAVIDHRVRRGLSRVAVMLGLLLLVAAISVNSQDPGDGSVLSLLMVSAAVSVVLIAEVTRLTMVKQGGALYVVSGALALTLLAGGLSDRGIAELIALHAAACAVTWCGVRLTNRAVWRTPEYALFWSTALRC